MTRQLLTLVPLFILAISRAPSVLASPCVAFNINWELLAFGFDGKDYNAGTQDQWASGSATDITASGRPPFDAANTTCYLSEFTNAIYVLNADSSNPSDLSIYDATAKSWTTQSVTAGSFDPTNFKTILDHDTNIFYALSNGELFSLDMGLLKSANSTAIPWVDQKAAGFTTTNYDPVMVIADNHIYFIDVPGVAAGSAMIFVIHYSYFQPEAQAYGSFPASHGQVTSFFLDSGVQTQFAYIPDDGSATYVVDVIANTTQTLAGPSTKDPLATYFASTNSLVQLTSSGDVNYLPFSADSTTTNAAASWSLVKALPVAVSSSSAVSSATGSATGSSSSTKTASGSKSSASASGSGSAASATTSSNGVLGMDNGRRIATGMAGALVLGLCAIMM